MADVSYQTMLVQKITSQSQYMAASFLQTIERKVYLQNKAFNAETLVFGHYTGMDPGTNFVKMSPICCHLGYQLFMSLLDKIFRVST